MTYLILKSCDAVRENMPTFEAILSSYHIKILKSWENEQAGTIELTTDAKSFPDRRSVKAAAYDCFDEDLISFKMA